MRGINAAVICSIGCIRGNNEDDFLFFGDYLTQQEINDGAHIVWHAACERALFGVFDGMGGGDFGERASSETARLLALREKEILSDETGAVLSRSLEEISDGIAEEARTLGMGTMGTTAAVLCLQPRTAVISNVGDSRVYLLRDGEALLLSRDHSLVYEQVLAGRLTLEEARVHPRSNAITRYIGMKNRGDVRLAATRVIDSFGGDRYLICSDGVSDLLPAARIRELLSGGASPDETAKRIVLAALEMGGKDNATCMVIDIEA